MSVAFVQGAYDRASSDKTTLTPSLTGVTAGNTLLLAITGYRAGTALPTSVSDGTNTWTLVADLSYAGATNKALLYVAKNVAGGNVTVTATWAGNFLGTAHLSEWSGADPIYPGDLLVTRTGTSTTPLSNATGICNYDGSVAIALVGITSSPNNPIGIDTPSGYTNLHIEQDGANYEGFSLDYKLLPSRASENPSWGTTTSGSWGSIVYVLKPPSPGVNLVQSAINRSVAASSISVTLNGVTEGNLLVAHLSYIGPSSPPAPPDTFGDGTNTYTTKYFEQMGFFNRHGLYYAIASSSGDFTFTVDWPEDMIPTIMFMEFSGADPDFPIEDLVVRTASNTSTGVTNPVRASIPDSIVLSAVTLNDSVGSPITLNAPAGYTLLHKEENNVDYIAAAVACKKAGYAVTENPSWGALGLAADDWGALMVAIKPPSKQVEVIQSATSVSTANETSRTVTLNGVQQGNRIVVIAASYAGNAQHTVSDTAGNEWVRLNTSGILASTSLLTTWITKNKVAAGNTTITVSGAGSGRYDIAAIELKNASEFHRGRIHANVPGTSTGPGDTAKTDIPNGITIAAYAGMGPGVGANDVVAHQSDYTTILDDNGGSDGLHASFCYRIEGELGIKNCGFTTTNNSLTIQPSQLVFIPVETPRWELIGIGAATAVASGNVSPAFPATTAAGTVTLAKGDLLVAAIGFRSNVAFTAPSGWTIHQQQNSGNTSTTTNASIGSGLIASARRGTSNPANTFTRTGGDVALSRIVAYRAVDCDGWSLDASSANTLAANSTTVTTTGLTTTGDLDLLIAAFCGADNTTASAFDAATDPTTASGATNTTTPPSRGTWLERLDSNTTSGADTTLTMADAVRETAGDTGTIQCTAGNSSRHVLVAAAFKMRAPLAAEDGTFIVSGNNATLTYEEGSGAEVLTADAGTFSLSGQAASLERGYLLSLATGSFAISGQAASLERGYLLSLATGSFSLSGQAASLERGYLLSLATGSFSLSGQAASLERGYLLSLATGSFSIAGQDASLQRARSLAVETGAFSLSGQAASLERGYLLSLANGSFSLSGQAASLERGYLLSLTTGSFTISGPSLAKPPRLSAATSSPSPPAPSASPGRQPRLSAQYPSRQPPETSASLAKPPRCSALARSR